MTSTRHWRGASFGARLLALTLVPLGALAVFGVQRVEADRELAEQHADIVETVALQRTVADVFPPAQLERVALEGLSRIDDIGVPRDIVVAFTGIDFEQTYGENVVDLERSLDALRDGYRDLRLDDGSLLGDRLARLRAAIEIQRDLSAAQQARSTDIGEAFDELATLLEEVLASGMPESAPGGPTTLRQAQVERLGGVLASADQYGASIVRGLMNRTAELRDATIGALAVHESQLDSFAALLAADDAARFEQVRATLVRPDLGPVGESIGAELALDPAFVQESSSIALGHLDYLRELHSFSTAFHSDVAEEVAADAAAADNQADRTTLIVIAVAAVSLLFALAVLWSVVAPIRRLTSRARRISEGELDLPPVRPRGPGDLRTLTHSMNDMIGTLHAIDQEVGRLAVGKDGSDRGLALPGAIGESIRSSFDRLAAVTDALHHSQELSDAIVSEADDAIWTVDEEGSILTANAAGAELVGLPTSEQLGRHITDLLDRTTGEARILTAGRDDRTALVTRSAIEAGGDRRSVVIAHDISERTQFEERLSYQANHDALTGLPNRFAVLGHLEGRLAGHDPIAVLFIDLDAFKAVNDAQGHAAGDQVLTEVAHHLRSSVRDDEFVGRLGGDEFVVVTQRYSQTADITALGHRLIREIEQPRVIGDRMFVLSASVGVATGEPGTAALDLIRRADNALYQAKRLGRGRVGVFDASMQERIEQETDLEMALRQAVRNDELVLHLQPMTDLTRGVVNGAEALVRWDRPGHGLVPPGQFIPIAERTSLIYEIERWVLHRACELVVAWRQRDPDCDHRIAVNVSGRHLIEGDLLADVDAVLELTGADPSMLELELTETQLLEDIERATAVLDALRDKGITIAVDDFGTGYSSMTYLRDLPIDAIKIDRSFVSRSTEHGYDSTVIEALLTIGRTLGLSVVAEGVETDAQLAYVRARGCDRAQGFLLAHPMPVADAEAVLFEAEHVPG